MKIALATLLALTPVSAIADEYQAGYSSSKTCYRSEYREEYVPGTENNPGYVKAWTETIEFPCRRTRIIRTPENTTRHLLHYVLQVKLVILLHNIWQIYSIVHAIFYVTDASS